MGRDRVILHCDCNSFFASVETVLNPSLRDVPMAVCGDPENRHGIILAKNEPAKAAGVVTAETIWKARQKCPSLQLVPPHHDVYAAFSEQVNAIYAQYTDMVESFGIDESWLDVTGSQKLFGDGKQIADRLRAEIKEKTGLTISVGVSFNKVFAKLGSDYKKPDATTVISRESVEKIVYPLPVDALLYVGGAVKKGLDKMMIRTIGDLAAADRDVLRATFGKAGEMLSVYARGEDNEPVRRLDDAREVKSVGNGMTFRRDLNDEKEMYTAIYMLSDTVAARLRKHGLFCRTVQLTVKTASFQSYSRQSSLHTATAVSREIADVAMELLNKLHLKDATVRMLTVTAANLTCECEETVVQTSFFEEETAQDEHEKLSRLENAMDDIREKYGRGSIGIGSLLKNDFLTVTSYIKNKNDTEKIEK